jgi:hypothetical protein
VVLGGISKSSPLAPLLSLSKSDTPASAAELLLAFLPITYCKQFKIKKKNKYIAEKLFTCSFRPAADRCRFWPREAINSAVKFEL